MGRGQNRFGLIAQGPFRSGKRDCVIASGSRCNKPAETAPAFRHRFVVWHRSVRTLTRCSSHNIGYVRSLLVIASPQWVPSMRHNQQEYCAKPSQTQHGQCQQPNDGAFKRHAGLLRPGSAINCVRCAHGHSQAARITARSTPRPRALGWASRAQT